MGVVSTISGLSEKDANEKKDHEIPILHVLEAYTNLYRIWKDDFLKETTVESLSMFLPTRSLLEPDFNALNMFFDEEWNDKTDLGFTMAP